MILHRNYLPLFFKPLSTALNLSRNCCNESRKIKHKVGQLLQLTYTTPPTKSPKKLEAMSNSLKIMTQHNLIRPSTPGMFHYLPLTMKCLNKLIRIIDEEMEFIGGQRIDMPCIISKSLWKSTDRWDAMGEELFKLKDRQNRELCLGPTHEEVATDLLSTSDFSYKQLPILIYQISKKYRDEIKPRFGLLRAREFLMKDLYSFDSSENEAENTYFKVGKAYESLLNRLGLKFVKVEANSGKIGGNTSHEFHLPATVGEDTIVKCTKCSYAVNAELHGDHEKCKCCDSPIENIVAIEVAHTFLLGTKYSKPLKANFMDSENKRQSMVMGCYGVGVSRLLAASLEVLSTGDQLRWPISIAPYHICIIPPKAGSKEANAELMANHIYYELSKIFPDDVIYDDRTNTTIGFRLQQAKTLGYPYVVIAGKTVLDSIPKFEVHDTYNGVVNFLTHKELFELAHQIRDKLLVHVH